MSHSPRTVVTVAMLATVATVYPGFLIAALSVQVSAEFEVTEATYGWGLGSFFLAATVASAPAGRLAQRIGPRRQMAGALLASAVAQLALAMVARSFVAVLVCLVLAGLVNAAMQTAVNLSISSAQLSRLGLAVSLKQSAMPTASLISGLAVPVFALTIGWRWAFGVGAAWTLLVALLVWRNLDDPVQTMVQRNRSPVTSMRILVMSGVGFGMLSFSAGGLAAWVVASGVDAGLSEGFAGVMMSVGAAAGIALRLFGGSVMDEMKPRPLSVAAVTAVVGSVGMALLGVRAEAVHVVATLVAFGGGWIWPAFTNFAVVRRNAESAAAATGVTQTGVYIGVFSAPLVTGALIEWKGYQWMWLVVAAMAVMGASVTASLSRHYDR
ncbi:MAG: MFS transporter [Acidimicrobiales bacterium]|nr:MFS transporter [Acidimicrobiales bacterium]